jgi:hypothetical protein
VTSAPSGPELPPAGGAKLTRYGIAGFLTVILGLAIIAGVLVSSLRGSTPDVQAALRAAGCTLRVVAADDPRDHLTTLDAEVEHNTSPPTNGPHFYLWAPWGLHGDPVDQLQVVHNLEHGGIVVQYGDQISVSDFNALKAFYDGDSTALLVAPLTELGTQFALEAWTAPPESERAREDFGEGRLALCPRFDDDAFTAFRDAYRYRGPESERFPREALARDF